ncbi:hypothetical protein [Hymenobacter sp. 102]|uniref:hypothetical protein n=1 Tax=Hymenobacter sp. 102 TaxID=3403152 RepID=UPI003CF7DF67
MRHPLCRLSQLLVVLCLALGSACDSAPVGKQPKQAAGARPDYAADLLRTGLVKPQHRRWLRFCDTTRLEHFQLGRTARRVRGWLSEYEALQEKHWHFNPDSLRIATEQEMEQEAPDPPSLTPMFATVIHLPNTPQEKQRVRAQTTLLVRQLRRARLLTANEHRILLPLAQAGRFYSRHNLLYNADEILALTSRLRATRTLPPVLQQLGFLTPGQARQLSLELRSGHLHDPVELLNRLPQARVFYRSDYPASLAPYLRQLHQDAAGLLQLTFSDFRFEVVQPGQLSTCLNCPEDQDVVVHLRVNGKAYHHRCALYAASTGSSASVYPEQFYQIFNQILADQAARHRLVFIESEREKYLTGPEERFGLWRLTSAQLEAVDTLEFSALHVTSAPGFSVLPTDTVTAALAAFTRLGFLRHLSPEQRAAAETRLRQARLSEREEILHYVPGSVGEYRGAPDYATWSYRRLLKVLEEVAGRRFHFVQVQDRTQPAEGGPLHFRLGGKLYRTVLDQASERPDARLFKLVQQALREQRVPGKFFEVQGGLAQSRGMVTAYVFLLPEQEQIIRRRQLLHLIDPTLTQEEQLAREEAEEASSL